MKQNMSEFKADFFLNLISLSFPFLLFFLFLKPRIKLFPTKALQFF